MNQSKNNYENMTNEEVMDTYKEIETKKEKRKTFILKCLLLGILMLAGTYVVATMLVSSQPTELMNNLLETAKGRYMIPLYLCEGFCFLLAVIIIMDIDKDELKEDLKKEWKEAEDEARKRGLIK